MQIPAQGQNVPIGLPQPDDDMHADPPGPENLPREFENLPIFPPLMRRFPPLPAMLGKQYAMKLIAKKPSIVNTRSNDTQKDLFDLKYA